jgi:hypothetical protein
LWPISGRAICGTHKNTTKHEGDGSLRVSLCLSLKKGSIRS